MSLNKIMMSFGVYDVIITCYEDIVILLFFIENTFWECKLTKIRSLNKIMMFSENERIIITISENRKIYEIVEFRPKIGFLMHVYAF